MKTKTKPPQFPTTHTLITENQITTAIKMKQRPGVVLAMNGIEKIQKAWKSRPLGISCNNLYYHQQW